MTKAAKKKSAMKRTWSPITSDLASRHVLVDLFDSDDFPVPIPDPEAAAEIVIQRLIDSGFEIKGPLARRFLSLL
jgi:hypothetical protein